MAVTHLIDTSVLTRLAQLAVRSVIEPMARAGHLVRPSICDLEIGFSARSAEEWDRLASSLGVFGVIETNGDHVRRALQVQRLLAARSQRGRKVPDLLVAAAAEEKGLVVLHYDADFERIATVTGQRHEWVVPAGSIS